MSKNSAAAVQKPVRFGAFIAPFHPLEGNPTLQLRRDLKLAEVLDELGFDEVWFGEHHSTGVETIGSPELMIAAAAENTRHIMLGTGVSSVSYHNPLILADRMIQLDHMTRGRVAMGIGPGQLASDAFMMGIDPVNQRDMMAEALDALVPLLRGETVTKKTDWFDLQEARVQLLPYRDTPIPMAVASVYSPTGVTLAGQHGIDVLSLAAGDPRGANTLSDAWAVHEKIAAENGNQACRERWRLVGQMHLSLTHEQAYRDLEWGVLRSTRHLETITGQEAAWRANSLAAVQEWTGPGLPTWGRICAGTPDVAIANLEGLVEKTGGFGTYLISITDAAPFAETVRSLELFAEYVIPHFRGSNRNRVDSLAWARENKERFAGRVGDAIAKATEKYGSAETLARH